MTQKKILIIVTTALLLLYLFSQCNSGSSSDNSSISTDSATIAAGEASFNNSCSGCHNFRQDGIGPQLGGLTSKVSADWIQHFIKNPQRMISSGDERARKLIEEYKVIMPSFEGLKEDEMNAIIAYLHTHKDANPPKANQKRREVSNPLPDSIELSNLRVNLKLVTQVPSSSDSGKMPLTRISKLSFKKSSNDLYILDLRGKLFRLQHGKLVVYMNMANLKPAFIPQPGLATGFGSFAFHPDFTQNGLLYTTHTEATGSGNADFYYADSMKVALQWVLTEWKTENPNEATFSGKSRELFRVNMVAGLHGVQEITFNPLSKNGDEDFGLLYIGVGDGGSVENGYPFLTHNVEKIWGTILRIDPMGRNSMNGQYGIPRNNPFVQNANGKTLKEIYAYGFRNPHRITWAKSGKMLASNIGQKNIESLNIITPGNDYGWPIREGRFVIEPYGDLKKIYPVPANDSAYHVTYPVAAYDHDEGKAISGGFEYWSTTIPDLTGKYIFGDIPTGRLFYVEMADIEKGKQAIIREWKILIDGNPHTLMELCRSKRVDLHFGRDSQGELYLLTKADGKVYKLVSATMQTSGVR